MNADLVPDRDAREIEDAMATRRGDDEDTDLLTIGDKVADDDDEAETIEEAAAALGDPSAAEDR